MTEIILYPTETIYGLGVNTLDENALSKLYDLKGRSEDKAVSWLVRDISDIENYAEVSPVAAKIAKQFLPGPLTLVLPLKKAVQEKYPFLHETIGFRISSDPTAQKIIAEYMEENNAPLTCTSANLSNKPTQSSVEAILNQFGETRDQITKVIDDGERSGQSSTVVSVNDSRLTVLREGIFPVKEIMSIL